MSSAKNETIADIVKEMRTLGRLDEKSTDKIPRSLQALGLRTYADRIEAAAKLEREAVCENSSHVGNAAAMREAVEAVVKVGYPHNFQKEAPHIRAYCYEITTAIKKCFAALSAPPSNCDVLSKDEVLETLKDRSFSKEDTIEWLYDEAKGGTK